MKKAAADWSYSGVLNQDVLQDWQESTRLEATENVTENDLFEVDEDEEDDAESLEIFEEHMDIQEPIRVLRWVMCEPQLDVDFYPLVISGTC